MRRGPSCRGGSCRCTALRRASRRARGRRARCRARRRVRGVALEDVLVARQRLALGGREAVVVPQVDGGRHHAVDGAAGEEEGVHGGEDGGPGEDAERAHGVVHQRGAAVVPVVGQETVGRTRRRRARGGARRRVRRRDRGARRGRSRARGGGVAVRGERGGEVAGVVGEPRGRALRVAAAGVLGLERGHVVVERRGIAVSGGARRRAGRAPRGPRRAAETSPSMSSRHVPRRRARRAWRRGEACGASAVAREDLRLLGVEGREAGLPLGLLAARRPRWRPCGTCRGRGRCGARTRPRRRRAVARGPRRSRAPCRRRGRASRRMWAGRSFESACFSIRKRSERSAVWSPLSSSRRWRDDEARRLALQALLLDERERLPGRVARSSRRASPRRRAWRGARSSCASRSGPPSGRAAASAKAVARTCAVARACRERRGAGSRPARRAPAAAAYSPRRSSACGPREAGHVAEPARVALLPVLQPVEREAVEVVAGRILRRRRSDRRRPAGASVSSARTSRRSS